MALLVLLSGTAPLVAAALPAFKLYVERPGAYRVSFEDLVAAGLDADGLPSAGLGVSCGGESVPVWVEDGGDGVFGPGDHVELLGEPLYGEASYYSEFSRYNVYVLRFDVSGPSRMRSLRPEPAPGELPRDRYRTREHLEQDLLILRLPPRRDGTADELWYWAKLTQIDDSPFTLPLDLSEMDEDGGDVVLRLGFRGWSTPANKAYPELADHRVEVTLGTRTFGADWNGTEPFVFETEPIPAAELGAGERVVAVRVPVRGDLIDVVMLNYVEIGYPRRPWIGDDQARFELAGAGGAQMVLAGPQDEDLRLYGLDGSRLVLGGEAGDGRRVASFLPPAGESRFVASYASQLLSPAAVVRDRPSHLAATENQADYLVITHRRFLEGVEPLVELHRQRGLTVTVADVEDVYDEFRHGLADPRALRDFISHAYHHWQRPAPRFVLLVGDASWDGKNPFANDANYTDWTYRPGETDRFGKNKSTPYAHEAGQNHRNLVPTWNHPTSQGHSASDNYFVAVDGDDNLPDLAVGRLPVVEPEELAGIVAKIRGYVLEPEPGPWRNELLLITNDDPLFQRKSDRLAGFAAAHGLETKKIYPRKEERDNARHTRRLLEELDTGRALVHFMGHGGRYIWRTGPPSRQKDHDLFTLDDLEKLKPTRRLPLVLSMTCYSAPFDHPSADSIGEKLLRLRGRGAIAVLAASWRNTPSAAWSRELLDELTAPGATIGEAVMRGKHRIGDPLFIGTYNLLGDPAVPLARPAAEIHLRRLGDSGDTVLQLAGQVEPELFNGEVSVELVDAGGEVLDAMTATARGGSFVARFELDAAETGAVRSVRAYAWDAEHALDAAGALPLAKPARPAMVGSH